jgi:hypothetical protein
MRQPRSESDIANGVECGTDVGQVIENLIEYLSALQGERKRREKNVRVRRRGQHDGSPDALVG